MKAGFLLLMHGNKVFHPDGVRKMQRGSRSNLAAGDGLWAGAAGAQGFGKYLGDNGAVETKGSKSMSRLPTWPKLGARLCLYEDGLR